MLQAFAGTFEAPDGETSPPVRPTVYVLACRDGSLYTGATTDLARRLAAHRRRKAAKYTRSRLPVALFAFWHPITLSAAKSHEARFKKLSRSAKLATLRSGEAFGCAVHRAVDLP
jgi:putative endonuclease